MYVLILAYDRAGALPLRLEIRQKHIDYWIGLGAVVKIGGAMLDGEGNPRGSSFIVETGTLEEARACLAADPFTREGVFGESVVMETLRPSIGVWKPD